MAKRQPRAPICPKIQQQLSDAAAAMATDPQVLAAISKMEPVQLQDDLLQETMVAILDSPNPERLVNMHSRGQLKFFVLGIIKRSAKSKSSPFYYKFRHKKYRTVELQPWHIE